MYALTEALDLDEAIAAKLFPFLKEHDTKLKERHVAKRTHSKALRKMVQAGDFPQRAADEHIEALGRIEIAIAELHAAQTTGLKKILSTEQRVKYVMVREKLEHEIRKTIRQHRRERMGGGAGGRSRMGGEGRRHRRGR
jgi:Spy/CpxP family protein refolding chaperone